MSAAPPKALRYHSICAEGAALLGPHAHPEVSLHTPSLADYLRHLGRGDLEAVGEGMLQSAHKLAHAGADFLICPDNTIHQAFDDVAALGIEYVRPNDTQRNELGRIIMQELVYGDVQPSSIRYCPDLIQTFQQQGCDAAVLGCTEIPLIIQDGNAALPTLDSTRLLARAARQRAVGGALSK